MTKTRLVSTAFLYLGSALLAAAQSQEYMIAAIRVLRPGLHHVIPRT